MKFVKIITLIIIILFLTGVGFLWVFFNSAEKKVDSVTGAAGVTDKVLTAVVNKSLDDAQSKTDQALRDAKIAKGIDPDSTQEDVIRIIRGQNSGKQPENTELNPTEKIEKGMSESERDAQSSFLFMQLLESQMNTVSTCLEKGLGYINEPQIGARICMDDPNNDVKWSDHSFLDGKWGGCTMVVNQEKNTFEICASRNDVIYKCTQKGCETQ